MAFPDWREPARLLRENHGRGTDEQIAVATRIGLYIDPCEPKAIVAGRIVRHLSGTLLLGPEDPPGSRQLEYLRVLAGSEDLSHLGSLDYAIASRWIQHFLSQRTLTALEQLRLARGDLVTSSWRPPQWDIFPHTEGATYVVSSIGQQGRVYFKRNRDPGMSGRRLLSSSWPAFLTLVARWEGPRRSQDGSMTGRLAPPPEARPVDENEPLIVGACRRIISSISPPPRPAPYRRPRAAEAALRARLLAQLEYEDLQRARELADAGLREQALTFLVERATRLQ